MTPFLNGMDLGVQHFIHGIADWIVDVCQNIVQMAFAQMSDVFYGCDATL